MTAFRGVSPLIEPHFGRTLSEARRLRRLSQMDLGGMAGVSGDVIGKYEAQKTFKGRDEFLLSIMRALHTPGMPLSPLELNVLTADMTTLRDRACAELAGVGRFAPNQLRHARGTLLARRAGLSVAQATLGHSRQSTTEHYVEPDSPGALSAAARWG